jgi:hypothetical protein
VRTSHAAVTYAGTLHRCTTCFDRGRRTAAP